MLTNCCYNPPDAVVEDAVRRWIRDHKTGECIRVLRSLPTTKQVSITSFSVFVMYSQLYSHTFQANSRPTQVAKQTAMLSWWSCFFVHTWCEIRTWLCGFITAKCSVTVKARRLKGVSRVRFFSDVYRFADSPVLTVAFTDNHFRTVPIYLIFRHSKRLSCQF